MASRTAPSEGDALLDAVLEHPDDDAPREVYAAWLSDRGDPRGEFIALQLAATKRALTAAEMRREASLLKNHAREWLGPIAPLVRHAQTRFTRGFPSHLTVYAPEASLLRTLTGNAIWATVEAVEFAHHVTTCSPKLSVQDGIVHPVFRSLRSVSGLEAKNVVEVCEAHRNRLEAVGIYGPADAKRRPGAIDAEEGKAIDALESLPLLKRVRVGGDRLASDSYCEDLRSRLRALVASRALDLFSVYGGYRNAELWLSDLEATGATIGCLEFRSDTCGVWAHEGLTIRTSISAGRLDECIRMIAMPRRTKDPAHRLALAMSSVVHHVLTFQAAGARRFEIVVPHGYDGQRTIDDTVASWAHRPALPELQFIEE